MAASIPAVRSDTVERAAAGLSAGCAGPVEDVTGVEGAAGGTVEGVVCDATDRRQVAEPPR
ncbi:hypothetical protein [Kitasatospora sp. NPDC096140]|uniref:hypothetical protein n=1 Tax=Kitasatospora sp. NPDC096140 TaxID=3155425 RepID=UPI00332F8BD9